MRKTLEDVNIAYDPPNGKVSARLLGYSALNRDLLSELYLES